MKRTLHSRGWLVLLCLGIALLMPAAVWAGFASINTDDGAIDPDWAGVAVFQTSPNDGSIDDAYDLKEAKITREADNSYWYFQAVLYGQLPLDNLTSVEARISCNGDSAFENAEDKIVLYYHADPATNDNSIECEGSDYPTCSNGEILQGSDFGEEVAVGDGTYSYEWKADISDPGGIDWSTCNAQETVQFAVADASGSTYDVTTPQIYNVPTIVRARRLSTASSFVIGVATLLGLGLIVSGVVLRRTRKDKQAQK